MSIANEIQRLQSAKADIKSAIEEKGVTVGNGTIDTYAEKISQISSGGGGAEINMGTCTVKFVVPYINQFYCFGYEQVQDGNISYMFENTRATTATTTTITKTVRCDSVLFMQSSMVYDVDITDGEVMKFIAGGGIMYRTPSTEGATATLTFYD